MEKYAREANLPLTLIRPGSFMENIGTNFFPVKRGRVRGFVDGDAKMPYVCCADIGALAAIALTRRPEFLGSVINAVGDLSSGDDIVRILSDLGPGKPFRYSAAPAWVMWLFAREFYAMRRTFERYGRPPLLSEIADLPEETRKIYPEATTMETFLRGRGFEEKAFA